MVRIRSLGPDDLALLTDVPEGLFDNAVDPIQAAAFLADPANVMLLAFEEGLAVGMVTATVLRHPDKPPGLFVNEVGTREAWQRRGIARAMLEEVLVIARDRGCKGVWLGTEADNDPANALYAAVGGRRLDGVFWGWDGAFDD